MESIRVENATLVPQQCRRRMNKSGNFSSGVERDECAAAHNFTLGSTYGFVYDRNFSVILLCLSTYLLVVLFLYEWKNFRKTDTAIVNRLVLLSSFAGFVYGLRIVLGLFVTSVPCRIYNYMGGVAYGACQSLIYTVLWARQRKFYADPLLSQSVPKVVKILSSVVILLIYVSCLVLPFTIVSFFCTTPTRLGCLILWNRASIYSTALPSFLASFAALGGCQIALFLLITHPLVAANTDGHVGLCRALCSKSQFDIFSVIKRLAFCSGVCIMSSIVLHCIVLLDALGFINTFWPSLSCADLIISNASISCTFVDWRERIVPFVYLRGPCLRKFCGARVLPHKSKKPANTNRSAGQRRDVEIPTVFRNLESEI